MPMAIPGIKKNISLKKYTTFKIGGKAKYFFEAKTDKEIINAIEAAKKLRAPFVVFGAGSNLLVADRGFSGTAIKISNNRCQISNSKISAGAGLPLPALAAKAAENSLVGLEWAAGIPGTVGGAAYGNAGAFGEKTQNSVENVKVYDIKKKKIKIFKNADCRFGYRSSVFKKDKNLIILSVDLKTKKGDKKVITEKLREYLKYRQERHPKKPSAGSIFKNIKVDEVSPEFFQKYPEAKEKIKEAKIPAAFLIAKAGLIGKKIRGAMISDQHPNFILNFKNAKASDVVKLINIIKKSVKTKFGINLEEEIQRVGF